MKLTQILFKILNYIMQAHLIRPGHVINQLLYTVFNKFQKKEKIYFFLARPTLKKKRVYVRAGSFNTLKTQNKSVHHRFFK